MSFDSKNTTENPDGKLPSLPWLTEPRKPRSSSVRDSCALTISSESYNPSEIGQAVPLHVLDDQEQGPSRSATPLIVNQAVFRLSFISNQESDSPRSAYPEDDTPILLPDRVFHVEVLRESTAGDDSSVCSSTGVQLGRLDTLRSSTNPRNPPEMTLSTTLDSVVPPRLRRRPVSQIETSLEGRKAGRSPQRHRFSLNISDNLDKLMEAASGLTDNQSLATGQALKKTATRSSQESLSKESFQTADDLSLEDKSDAPLVLPKRPNEQDMTRARQVSASLAQARQHEANSEGESADSEASGDTWREDTFAPSRRDLGQTTGDRGNPGQRKSERKKPDLLKLDQVKIDQLKPDLVPSGPGPLSASANRENSLSSSRYLSENTPKMDQMARNPTFTSMQTGQTNQTDNTDQTAQSEQSWTPSEPSNVNRAATPGATPGATPAGKQRPVSIGGKAGQQKGRSIHLNPSRPTSQVPSISPPPSPLVDGASKNPLQTPYRTTVPRSPPPKSPQPPTPKAFPTADDGFYDIDEPVVVTRQIRSKSVKESTRNTARKPSKRRARKLKRDSHAAGGHLRPFSYNTLVHLLESMNGTVIGEEFDTLNLPIQEKQLIEKVIDLLSRLTLDMVTDKHRYAVGLERLEKAHRVLEGFL